MEVTSTLINRIISECLYKTFNLTIIAKGITEYSGEDYLFDFIIDGIFLEKKDNSGFDILPWDEIRGLHIEFINLEEDKK